MDGREETRQLQVALGIWLLIAGVLWMCVQTVMQEWVTTVEEPYLAAVLSRSLSDPYRLALLSAVIAVAPHALWVGLRSGHGKQAVAVAYDRAGVLLQTLFTSFGFLGTIMGVSIAVSGLDEAMDSREPGLLIDGLGTAFDTTFLGLVGAIAIMISRRLISLSGTHGGSA